MVIRDKRMNWTAEAVELSNVVKDALKPTLEIAKGLEFSLEDWFYIVTHTADDIIIDICLETKGWIKKNN